TDLVRRIAVRRDAISANDHGIESPLLKEMTGHVVGDQRDVDSILLKLPRREARALQIRPCFVGKYRDVFPLLDGGANDTKRSAVTGRSERAGIAVREHCRGLAEEVGAEAADAVVRLEVLAKNCFCFFRIA